MENDEKCSRASDHHQSGLRNMILGIALNEVFYGKNYSPRT
jgi:hypothetical protein